MAKKGIEEWISSAMVSLEKVVEEYVYSLVFTIYLHMPTCKCMPIFYIYTICRENVGQREQTS